MDYKTYRRKYYTDPPPESRYQYAGLCGATLFFEDYEAAVAYYQDVLGPPAYIEGESTKGWRIADTWLTLLRGVSGSPKNVEIQIVMDSPGEAERLQRAFIDAGGEGTAPSDQLMYEPIRMCPVVDPFGTNILIYSLRSDIS